MELNKNTNMTKEEALQIPELKIFPNELIEDCFFYKMAKAGRLSEKEGHKALQRLHGQQDDPCCIAALAVADLMIANLDKYGVPCAAWCKE